MSIVGFAWDYELDILYYSVYSTQGQRANHSNRYISCVTNIMQTAFPELFESDPVLTCREIITPSNPNPIEILHSENSTGIISGMRKRLEEKKLREAPKEEEKQEVTLVTNDEYNAVEMITSFKVESSLGSVFSRIAWPIAPRIPVASSFLDAAARTRKACPS